MEHKFVSDYESRAIFRLCNAGGGSAGCLEGRATIDVGNSVRVCGYGGRPLWGKGVRGGRKFLCVGGARAAKSLGTFYREEIGWPWGWLGTHGWKSTITLWFIHIHHAVSLVKEWVFITEFAPAEYT